MKKYTERHSEESYNKAFQNAVIETIGKLVKDYGLQLEQKGPDTFLIPLSSFDIKIDFGLETHQYQIGAVIIPRDTLWGKKYSERFNSGIGIINYIRCENPEFPETYFLVNSPDDIPGQVKRLCELLQQYCSPLLHGDFSIWPSVVAYVENEIEKIRKSYEVREPYEPYRGFNKL